MVRTCSNSRNSQNQTLTKLLRVANKSTNNWKSNDSSPKPETAFNQWSKTPISHQTECPRQEPPPHRCQWSCCQSDFDAGPRTPGWGQSARTWACPFQCNGRHRFLTFSSATPRCIRKPGCKQMWSPSWWEGINTGRHLIAQKHELPFSTSQTLQKTWSWNRKCPRSSLRCHSPVLPTNSGRSLSTLRYWDC